MGTEDVRIDSELNKLVWSHGIRHVPVRLRVRLSRERNKDEGAANRLYTVAKPVTVPSLKGLGTTEVADEAAAS